jgi:hypothetical protein
MIIFFFEMIGSFLMIFGAVGACGFWGGVFAFGLSLLLIQPET